MIKNQFAHYIILAFKMVANILVTLGTKKYIVDRHINIIVCYNEIIEIFILHYSSKVVTYRLLYCFFFTYNVVSNVIVVYNISYYNVDNHTIGHYRNDLTLQTCAFQRYTAHYRQSYNVIDSFFATSIMLSDPGICVYFSIMSTQYVFKFSIMSILHVNTCLIFVLLYFTQACNYKTLILRTIKNPQIFKNFLSHQSQSNHF